MAFFEIRVAFIVIFNWTFYCSLMIHISLKGSVRLIASSKIEMKSDLSVTAGV